jgi:hypothetical protein
MGDWAGVVASWAPLVILIGALVYFVRRGGLRSRGPSGQSLFELYERQIDESKKTNALIERIAVALEKSAGSASH